MSLMGTDLMALNDLLQTDEEEVDGPLPNKALSGTIVPAAGRPAASHEGEEADEGEQPKKKVKDPKDIWDEDEVPPEDAIVAEDHHDSRSRPKYDILYKQAVMTEDMYLGTEKTPGSTDCTHMTIKIEFPGHSMKDLDLDVTKQKLRAESNRMLLSIYLPMPANADEGIAKWDSKKETLVVTLPIIRDEW